MRIESEHTVNVGQFFLTHGEALNFPLHLHRAFEYFGVRSGTANVIIDGETYTLDAGTAVLIFPYQLHSYQSAENCYEMAIFSPDMVESFAHRVNGLCPADNRFPLPPVDVPESSPNAFLKKSAAYALCGWFDAVAQYRPKTAPPPDDLLTNILLYVEAHRHSTCTLQDVAREVRYDYAYISKFFIRKMGVQFHAYVNRLRIEDACRWLRGGGKSMEQIAESCGFASLRSFYRTFHDVVGTTPAAYRDAPGAALNG